MADTQLVAASYVSKWDAQFMTEYVRQSRFRPYMGAPNTFMPIQVRTNLEAGGKTLNIPLITRLKSGGVQGSTRLSGNEEALDNFNQSIGINFNRNGVRISRPDEHFTEMDLRAAAREQLKVWAAESLRDDIICAMLAFDGNAILKGKGVDQTGTAARTPLEFYASYSEATKDAWLAANTDRFLFGAAVSNHSANDHSAALANIDTTADRMTTKNLSLAKYVATKATRQIRPTVTDDPNGREMFVCFVGNEGFRDLQADTAMQSANRDARPREVMDNPLFQGGDLYWDGIIIRHVPEIPVITGVGASTSDVAPAFLCGAQAVACVWGQKPVSRIGTETDFNFQYPVAIEEARGCAKLVYEGKQHGMVTMYHSAPATAA